MSQKHKQGVSAATVVVSPRGLASWSGRRKLVVLAVVVVVVVAAVMAVLLMTHKKAVAPTPEKAASPHSKAMDQAEKLNVNNDFKDEAESLKAYLATKPSKTDANEATMKLAASYMNTGDYDQAIVYLKQVAASDDDTFVGGALSALGTVYAKKGDKASSADYYQQAIKVYQDKGDTYRVTKNQNMLKKMQAQP